MTVLHVLFLLGKKSAEDTLQTAKLLLDHGLRELINEADSLGNTPLHALIVRYALEEAKYGYGYGGYGDRHEEPQPWNKWDMLHIVRYLIHQVGRVGRRCRWQKKKQKMNRPSCSFNVLLFVVVFCFLL